MKLIAGVDEAGRGPLAGPVIAAAVILPNDHSIIGLKDSKKISKKNREILFKTIKEEAVSIGIGESSVEVIDRINIREATFKAMQIALEQLNPRPIKALIDGHTLNFQEIPNKGIIGGDNLIDSIKAASIIAKVTRDKIMKKYSLIFPEYGFENHVGYGTVFHNNALKLFKASPIHRRTFKPVKSQLPTFTWLLKNNKINWMGRKIAALHVLKNKEIIIRLINNHKFSNQINLEGIARKNFFLKVSAHYIEPFTKIDQKIISKSIEDFKTSITNEGKVRHDHGQCRFGHIFVGLKKGGPIIQYKKDIYLV